MPPSMTLSRAARLVSKLIAEAELLFTTGYRRAEEGHQRQRGPIVDSPFDHNDQSRAAATAVHFLMCATGWDCRSGSFVLHSAGFRNVVQMSRSALSTFRR